LKLSISKISAALCILIILGTNFLYYPKWTKGATEATISWDVSGYYMYLPATFIYKDLKQLEFLDKIIEKYKPTPDPQQAFLHKPSGNQVMKYSLGQAVTFLPGFTIGHSWASISGKYPTDGFSFPYQFCIAIGSLLWAILGIILLRKILLPYFDEKTVGLTLVTLLLGSNYLNYVAIDSAMTHNTLLTLYCALIYLTMSFYKRATLAKAIGIGW